MEAVLTSFQSDLRQGLGLWEALQKHNLTLKYAMDHLDKPRKPAPRRRRGYKSFGQYVYRIDKYYTVQKTLNNRSMNFGSYNALSEAKLVRDYYLEHGWDRSRLDEICEKLGVTRRK